MNKRLKNTALALTFICAIFTSTAPGAMAKSPHSTEPTNNSHQTQSNSQSTNYSHAQNNTNTSSGYQSSNASSGSYSSSASDAHSSEAHNSYPSSSKPSVTEAVATTQTSSVASSVVQTSSVGNRGTVKIHDSAGDTSPHNQPHVGCNFWAAFFNYTPGNTYSDVNFSAHPPSGTASLLNDRVFVGGGSSIHGFDTDQGYNLSGSLSGLAYNPNQGYHIKLSADTEGTVGGAKHKVFWVNCPQSQTTTSTPPVGGQGGGTPIVTTTQPLTPTAGGRGGGTPVIASSQPISESSQPGSLPFTGSHDSLPWQMVVALMLLLATGSSYGWPKTSRLSRR